jgi:hypothetical protein
LFKTTKRGNPSFFFLRIEVLGREANIQEQGVIYVLHPFILPLGVVLLKVNNKSNKV